jgi:hypothetical protein
LCLLALRLLLLLLLLPCRAAASSTALVSATRRSFDLAAVAKGCEVHAFDPTIIVLPHGSRQADGQALCSAARRSSSYRRERGYSQGEDTRRCLPNPSSEIHFHDYGLYGADAHLANVGDVKTLRTIMSELGHAHVDVNELKIDIEGSSWTLFADDDSDGTPEQMAQSVGQVMMEIHMHPDELAVQLAAMPGAPGSDYQPQSAVGQLLSLRPPALNFYRRALNRMVSLGFGANPTSISLAFTFPNGEIYLLRFINTGVKNSEVADLHTNPSSAVHLLGMSAVLSCHEVVWVKRRESHNSE